MRKVYGAIKYLDQLVKKNNGAEYLVGNALTIADIAAGAMLGMFEMAERELSLFGWKKDYPDLVGWWEKLEERPSFKETRPVMFQLTEKVA